VWHQQAFVEKIFDLMEKYNVTEIDIEVQWAPTKKRSIQVRRSGSDLELDLG
jgi:hypothetical protein